jgi:3-phenylpropionate/trans-cinnamate dioxygenase ferredoxin reductase subunit
MAEWRRIARSEDIKEDEPLVIELDEDESVLVTRVNGTVCACGNECPHYGGPLGDGVLHNGTVRCPYHNAAFSVEDGKLVTGPAIDDLPRYSIREEDGAVFLGNSEVAEIPMPEGSDGRSILIVGAGAAASSCAETLRREGFAGEITMITGEQYAPYDRPMLSKSVISGNAPAKAAQLRDDEFYNRLNIATQTGDKVVKVDPEKKLVTTASGATHSGDMILLASGSVPRTLDLPGKDLSNVFTLRSRDDAAEIAAASKDAERAVVIGANFIGMETAAELKKRGLDVYVVEPQEEPMAGVFGPEVGRRFRRMHESEGVYFHLGCRPSALGGESSVETVALEDGNELAADLVVIGVGVDPALDYLKESGLVSQPSDGVRVDERLQTSTDGIYAAGDIAQFPAHGARYRVEHWVHAQQQGAHVARVMLGSQEPFTDVPFFWTRQYTTTVKYAGYPVAHDAIEYRGDVDSGSFLAGYFSDGRLVAVSTIGMQDPFVSLMLLLEAGEKVTPSQFSDM